jgi:Tol biopolymer transport system component
VTVRAALGAVLCLLAAAGPAAAQERIAFTSYSEGDARIGLVAPDGSGRGLIPGQRGNTFDPAWSPDGALIAFASDRDARRDPYDGGPFSIYVMARDGSNVRRVTTPRDASDYAPTFSPDGRSVAFVRSAADEGLTGLYVVGLDGSGDRMVVALDDVFEPAWSPDGSTIAYSRSVIDERRSRVSASLWAVPAAGGEQRLLASDGRSPAWSPDGSRIAFASGRDRNGEDCSGDYCSSEPEIYSMRADGTDARRLTVSEQADDQPTWSPDGSRIAFDSDRFYPAGQSSELHAMRADGSCVVRLTAGAPRVGDAAWSPAPPAVTPLVAPEPDPCAQPALSYERADHSAAARFRRFRLMWPGEDFESIVATRGESTPHRSFYFLYEDCLDSSGACGVPFSIQVSTICARHPLWYSGPGAFADRRFRVRGALVAQYGEDEPMWDVHLGATTVTIFADAGPAEPRRVRRIVAALRPFGAASAPARQPSPAFPPSMLRRLRAIEGAVRREGFTRARLRLRLSRSGMRDRLALARTIRALPRASAADRRAAARCDRGRR